MMLALVAAAAMSAAPLPPPTTLSAAPTAQPIQEQWTVLTDASLSATLSGWAQRAGWKVVWETDDDFHLAAGANVAGDFPAAATQLIDAFSHSRPRLRAIFYNTNRVLRVWTERNEP